MSIASLLQVYQEQLGCDNFWHQVIGTITDKSSREQYIDHPGFLYGLPPRERLAGKVACKVPVKSKCHTINIDVPVWFGNIRSPKRRVIVYGLEPRYNRKFEIGPRRDNVSYSTAFGAEAWNAKSKKPGKPQLKYGRYFLGLSCGGFLLLSDIVKYFIVKSKMESDKPSEEDIRNARDNFPEYSEEDFSKNLIIRELKEVKPTHIILLSNELCRYFVGNFAKLIAKYGIHLCMLAHPGAWGVPNDNIERLEFVFPGYQYNCGQL